MCLEHPFVSVEVVRVNKYASLEPFLELKKLVEEGRHSKDFTWNRLGKIWNSNDKISVEAFLPTFEQVTIANKTCTEERDEETKKYGFYLHTPPSINVPSQLLKPFSCLSTLVLGLEDQKIIDSLLNYLHNYIACILLLSRQKIGLKTSWFIFWKDSNSNILCTLKDEVHPLGENFTKLVRKIQNNDNETCTIIADCFMNNDAIMTTTTTQDTNAQPVDVWIICLEHGFPVVKVQFFLFLSFSTSTHTHTHTRT